MRQFSIFHNMILVGTLSAHTWEQAQIMLASLEDAGKTPKGSVLMIGVDTRALLRLANS